MTTSTLRLAAIGLAGAMIAGLAGTTGFANSSNGSVQCGLVSGSEGGMATIEAALLSPTALTGEYRFAIRSSSGGGSSNISQGGPFSASANQTTTLGKVMLNAGATYDIDLTVTANGKKIECSQDIASLR